MARLIKINTRNYDIFSAFDSRNENKIEGLSLAVGDFAIRVKYRGIEKNIDEIGLTLAEYPTHKGDYLISFIFNQKGLWEIEVKVNQSNNYYYEKYDVVEDYDSASDTSSLLDIRGTVTWNPNTDQFVMLAWLLKNGDIRTNASQAKWKLYDDNSNLLFEVVSANPGPQGVFRSAKNSPGLEAGKNYFYTIEMYYNNTLIKSALSFITVLC